MFKEKSMTLLNENIQKQVRQFFEKIQNPVRLLIFTQGEGGALECQMCQDTRQLVEEVALLSEKISLEVYDFLGDAKVAEQYGVDKIPAVVIAGDKDYGVRLYGIPSGYEFSSLIEAIVAVGRRQPSLNKKTLQEIQRLDKPVHLQVFVTPT
jgi:glutaredoxin-like protein